MKKLILPVLFFCLVVLGLIWQQTQGFKSQITAGKKPRTWQIKSVDTMKYSRDLAREKLNDITFDQTIDLQIKSISELGATHVAIGTPYDDKFLPYLERWVKTARLYGLKVWFRGNFVGWEGWFGFEKNLTRDQHIEKVREFIASNGQLFENGDIFSPCPECENGGAGDPRKTQDVKGFRNFMIDEYHASNEQFRKVGKNVKIVGSMNYDVAKLIMDEQTANSLDNLVAIDHYVKDPQELARDIDFIANAARSNIMLGELGVPIPDIHGKLTEQEQEQWLNEALTLIAKEEAVIGFNYWVGYGGTTAIFQKDGTKKAAALTLENYFKLTNLENK